LPLYDQFVPALAKDLLHLDSCGEAAQQFYLCLAKAKSWAEKVS
jgi:hypothetical protein